MRAETFVRVLFFRSRRYSSTSKRLTCTRTKRTRQRRIFHIRLSRPRFAFSYRKKKRKRKKWKDLFLLPRFYFYSVSFLFLFYLYGFFSLSLFSFRQLTKLEHRHSLPSRHVLLSLKHPPYNILWLTFNPYSSDIFDDFNLFYYYKLLHSQTHDSPSYRSSLFVIAATFGHHRTQILSQFSISKHLFIQMISLIFY